MGARFKKKSASKQMMIAGVPVTNYRADADDFTILFKKGSDNVAIKHICAGMCAFEGNPDAGGLAFGVVKGRKQLEEILIAHGAEVELLEPDEVDEAIPELEVEDDIGAQWGEKSWGLPAIGAETRPTTGKGVHVYVHDTGVRTSHMEFGGRATTIADVSSGEMVFCEGDRTCGWDKIGHGTHCSGTTSGRTFGVAPDSKVYSFKVLADTGFGQRSWNVAAIDWVVTTGSKPAVISLSLGGKGVDPVYKACVDTATEAGVTVVAAAGNFGTETCDVSPAFVPNAITVGATTSAGVRAAYSNWGECNDIFAPGTHIYSASNDNDFSPVKMTGTSMACPHVSGAAALLLERNPTWKRDDIMEHFKAWGKRGYVDGKKSSDPDLFLWVGKDPAPGPPICPDWTRSTEPGYWGDCQCKEGYFCSTNGSTKNCPTSYGVGGWGGDHFKYQCRDCKCYQ